MEKTAAEIQKERRRIAEEHADALLKKCEVLMLASVNEKGFPRVCAVSKLAAESFRDIYFITSKRSQLNGKATHFEKNNRASVCYTLGNDSVTLVGTVEFIADRSEQELLWREEHRRFFPKGLDDPKLRILKFHTAEATFWINGMFRTYTYK